jgi:hypothetical protein
MSRRVPENGAMPAGLRAFYDADPRRGASAEQDLGLHWRSVTGATYRAAWIAETEELYAVRSSGASDSAGVTVLARVRGDLLEPVLAGWRRVASTGEPGSYEWLVDRTAACRMAA